MGKAKETGDMAIGEHISTGKRITALENGVSALVRDIRKLIIWVNDAENTINELTSISRKGQI